MTAEHVPYDEAAMQAWLDAMPEPVPEPPDPRRHFIVAIASNPAPKIVMEERYADDGSLSLIPKDDEKMRKILADWDAKPVWHRVAAVDDRGLVRDTALGGGGEVSGTRRMATGCGIVVEDDLGNSNSATRLHETVADPWIWETRCHATGCWAVPTKGAPAWPSISRTTPESTTRSRTRRSEPKTPTPARSKRPAAKRSR